MQYLASNICYKCITNILPECYQIHSIIKISITNTTLSYNILLFKTEKSHPGKKLKHYI